MSQKKKITIVFDLDNTLIRTERIKEMFRKLAQEHGFSEEQAYEIYDKARTKNGKIQLSWSRFVEELSKDLENNSKPLDVGKTKTVESELRTQGAMLLLSGADRLLSGLKKKSIDMLLLSLGVKEWQQEKILWAGLDKYFPNSKIIYTEKDDVEKGKAEALRQLFGKDFNGRGVILFNDKLDESKDLLALFPYLIVFLRCEKDDARYSEQKEGEMKKKYGDRLVLSGELGVLGKELKQYV